MNTDKFVCYFINTLYILSICYLDWGELYISSHWVKKVFEVKNVRKKTLQVILASSCLL